MLTGVSSFATYIRKEFLIGKIVFLKIEAQAFEAGDFPNIFLRL